MGHSLQLGEPRAHSPVRFLDLCSTVLLYHRFGFMPHSYISFLSNMYRHRTNLAVDDDWHSTMKSQTNN